MSFRPERSGGRKLINYILEGDVGAVHVKGKGFSFVPAGQERYVGAVRVKGKGFSFVPAGAGTIVETTTIKKTLFTNQTYCSAADQS
ncbi:MAG TPA: hypothetical protein PK191_05890 [Niabella sp.]|nr:hypothetical protein [Niabella sp.]HOZ96309.1 hypothetical protein [Niabella sp.]HQW14615.1 hypothetical protein [Niabella sp.]HQX19756.1 hypothetical protein [Niabella sp.]HRB08426.1 hypothetical protein [Niabella sp.]